MIQSFWATRRQEHWLFKRFMTLESSVANRLILASVSIFRFAGVGTDLPQASMAITSSGALLALILQPFGALGIAEGYPLVAILDQIVMIATLHGVCDLASVR